MTISSPICESTFEPAYPTSKPVIFALYLWPSPSRIHAASRPIIEKHGNHGRGNCCICWTKRTDLNAAVLDRFREELKFTHVAKLSDIEMSDEVLEQIGFFI